MSEVVKAGVQVVVKSKDFEHDFEKGDVVTSTGRDFGPHPDGVWTQFIDTEGHTQYLLAKHYDVVTDKPVTQKAKTVDPSLPSKATYAVVDAVGSVVATAEDRDYARELKAALGGKRKGIRIFQYTAEKEIR
jgi:hypothetical protein